LDLLLSIGTHEYPQALSSPPSKPSSSFPEKGGKKKQAADKKQLGRRVLAFQKTRIQSQSYTSKHSLP